MRKTIHSKNLHKKPSRKSELKIDLRSIYQRIGIILNTTLAGESRTNTQTNTEYVILFLIISLSLL